MTDNTVPNETNIPLTMTDDDGSVRRSKRKRLVPIRFGFHRAFPNEAKRRKTAAAAAASAQQLTLQGTQQLTLQSMPEEVLQRILCEDLCAVSEHFALHTTSKQFHRLSSSANMRKNVQFLNGPNDTKHPVTAKELLPFAREGNLDAIFLLGLIATYAEDDLETGLALLERGAQNGCNRARYELGIILQRVRVDREPDQRCLNAGLEFIDMAAAAGHVPSEMEKNCRSNAARSRQPWSKETKEKAREEEDSRTLLLPLINEKPDPPRPKWAWESCTRASCIRGSYNNLSTRCKAWLKAKPFSSSWQECRQQVLDCGIPSPYYCPDNVFCLPVMSCCGGCIARNTTYCSKVCQLLDWGRHRNDCDQVHRHHQAHRQQG